jgi:hypothetical protein
VLETEIFEVVYAAISDTNVLKHKLSSVVAEMIKLGVKERRKSTRNGDSRGYSLN